MIDDFKLVSEAKSYFRGQLNKGIIVTESKLLASVEDSLQPASRELLKNWYRSMTECRFLLGLPSQFEEVFIHSADELRVKQADRFLSIQQDMVLEDIEAAFEIKCIENNVDWNLRSPFVSFYFKMHKFSFRASLVHGCLCPEGRPKFFLRLLQDQSFQLESFGAHAPSIGEMITDHKNILIAGATGSGKTSFISAMIPLINKRDHLIILEDTHEILGKRNNTTRLLAQQKENFTLDDLLTYSLRMSPDRLILGELRSNEIRTYIQALNTGHRGVLSTIHANSAKDAIFRAATLYQLYSGVNLSYELALKLVSQNIDYVIHLKNKKVTEIIEVFASEGSNLFFDKVG